MGVSLAPSASAYVNACSCRRKTLCVRKDVRGGGGGGARAFKANIFTSYFRSLELRRPCSRDILYTSIEFAFNAGIINHRPVARQMPTATLNPPSLLSSPSHPPRPSRPTSVLQHARLRFRTNSQADAREVTHRNPGDITSPPQPPRPPLGLEPPQPRRLISAASASACSAALCSSESL